MENDRIKIDVLPLFSNGKIKWKELDRRWHIFSYKKYKLFEFWWSKQEFTWQFNNAKFDWLIKIWWVLFYDKKKLTEELAILKYKDEKYLKGSGIFVTWKNDYKDNEYCKGEIYDIEDGEFFIKFNGNEVCKKKLRDIEW